MSSILAYIGFGVSVIALIYTCYTHSKAVGKNAVEISLIKDEMATQKALDAQAFRMKERQKYGKHTIKEVWVRCDIEVTLVANIYRSESYVILKQIKDNKDVTLWNNQLDVLNKRRQHLVNQLCIEEE